MMLYNRKTFTDYWYHFLTVEMISTISNNFLIKRGEEFESFDEICLPRILL